MLPGEPLKRHKQVLKKILVAAFKYDQLAPTFLVAAFKEDQTSGNLPLKNRN